MLRVEGLRSCYGRIEVLHGIDLEVTSGQIVAVIGANGAGKTTLLRCLSGIQPISGGSIRFRGHDLASVPAHRRIGLGLAQAPEGRQVFTNLTVEENLRLGAYLYRDDRVAADMAEAFALFPALKERRGQRAGALSGGQQQMLSIARALMGRPRCLLLDEPSMGLAPILAGQMFDTVQQLRRLDVTVVLIEQSASAALAIADHGYVMENGRIALAGPAAELMADPRVRKVYLGI